MNRYENPAELAWKLASRAARRLIAKATNIRLHHEIMVGARAERILATSWLPAAAALVASNRRHFDIVVDDAPPELQHVYTAWANEVVDLARRTLIR